HGSIRPLKGCQLGRHGNVRIFSNDHDVTILGRLAQFLERSNASRRLLYEYHLVKRRAAGDSDGRGSRDAEFLTGDVDVALAGASECIDVMKSEPPSQCGGVCRQIAL